MPSPAAKKKELVLDNGATEAAAELIAAEIFEGFAIRCGGGERFGAEYSKALP